MIPGVLLGAAAGLDRTAFGQTLLAHPFVAASLSGALVGDPVRGLEAGLVLWMLAAPRVPVGETRVRDWTTAAVVLPWCVPAEAGDAAWTLALCVAVGVALAGGAAIEGVRDIARRSVEIWRARPAEARTDPTRLHLGLTSLHAARGAMVAALAIVGGRWFVDGVVDAAGPRPQAFLETIWTLAPWGLLPLLWRVHGDLGRGRFQWSLMALGALGGGAVRWFAGGAS